MEANELRIGNLVTYLGELYQVSGMRTQKDIFGKEYVRVWIAIDELQTSKTINWLQPIQLDEQWFTTFGFVYGNNHGCWVLLEDNAKGDYLDENVVFVFRYSAFINYVHQLQNLYFALTGQELRRLSMVQP